MDTTSSSWENEDDAMSRMLGHHGMIRPRPRSVTVVPPSWREERKMERVTVTP
jgi:hypothetical protein